MQLTMRCLPGLLLLVLLTSFPPGGEGKKANVKVMPVFRNLPEPLIYYRQGGTVTLTCSVQPRSAKVQLVLRPALDFNFVNVSRARSGSVTHVVQNPDNLLGSDLHCRARTRFGQMLSRPIRLVKTVLNSSSADRFTQTFTFYRGNVAQVVCKVPFSQPPATVEFLKDGDRIGQLDKYQVVRVDSRKVVMLIKDFTSTDTGIYSCRATNPRTMEHVSVRHRARLSIESPHVKMKARLHVEDPYRTKQKKVVLREGENATLYCLPEGAPIPSVKWYRHSQSKSLPKNAQIDHTFGTLRLNRVGLSDASVYMCSVEQEGQIIITSPITVTVLPRLKIKQAPRDVRISGLKQSAKFNCIVSSGCPATRNCKERDQVRPEWYYNGRYIDPRSARERGIHITAKRITSAGLADDSKAVDFHSSLTITRVTSSMLGIYQCVARSRTEWDSASAALALKKDRVINGVQRDAEIEKEREEKRRVVKPPPRPGFSDRRKVPPFRRRDPYNRYLYPATTLRPNSRLLPPPSVRTLYDNLAVEVTWTYSGADHPNHYRLQYMLRPARITGRTSGDPWRDIKISSIDERITRKRFVVLNELKAGYVFRFRVIAVFASGSVTSDWSKEIDFSHVIPAAPDIISITPVGSTSLRVAWTYSHVAGYPPLDSFVLFTRQLLNKDKGTYGYYTEFHVKATERSYLLTKLRPSANYQVVIHGLMKKRGDRRRMITRFSNEVSKSTAPAPPVASPPGESTPSMTSRDSTKLMFWILGGLASVMVLVMAILVAMCFLRQRREKKRSRAALHAQVNGTSLDSYKDPAKLLHRRQQAQAQSQANSQFLLAQLSQGGNGPPGSGPGTWAGPHHHGQTTAYLRGSSASVQQLHQMPPGSAMNLNVVPETQSLMLDHYQQQQTGEMNTDLGGYGPPPVPGGMFPMHGHHHPNGTLGSKSQLAGLSGHQHGDHEMGDLGYPMHTGSVGPYRPLGSGYAPFMTSGLRPSHLDVRPPPSGDAESIYSYFSQQEMGVQHCGLNDVPGGPPMPYRPQLAEAGSQTTERQQHRHHRRRRRKQPPGGPVPPTGPGGPLPVSMEHGMAAPSPPMMRDMAVNTDLSSDGTYDQPGAQQHAVPPGYHPHGHPQGGNLHSPPPVSSRPPFMPAESAGVNVSMAPSGPYHQSVSPPARLASLSHGYHQHHQQPPQHHQQPQQQPELGPGHADASTLTRRGTPTLFVDPPKMRDYSEYAIPETKA